MNGHLNAEYVIAHLIKLLKIFHDRQILLYLVELPGRGLTTE